MNDRWSGIVLYASLYSVASGLNVSSHIEETSVDGSFWDSISIFSDPRLKEKLLIILEVVLIGVAFLAAVMALAVLFLLVVSKCRQRCSRNRMSRQQSQRPPHPSVLKMDI